MSIRRQILPQVVVLAFAVFGACATSSVGHACEKPCKSETARCIAERCDALHGPALRTCRETCRGIGGCADIRTLAYVHTVCRSDASGSSIRQTLMIRRGNCAPVPVMELPAGPPMPDIIPGGACRLYGEYAVAVASVLAAPFQRLAVSRNARHVVFEVAGDRATTLLPSLQPVPAEMEGMWYVRSDGTGLRRLGRASRQPRWTAFVSPNGQLRIGDIRLQVFFNSEAEFSADSRMLAYSDLGPGPDGEEAPQVWVKDVQSDTPARQLTHLSKRELAGFLGGYAFFMRGFIGSRTIVFFALRPNAQEWILDPFTVTTDGDDVQPLELPAVAPGGIIDPNFAVVGHGGVTHATLGNPRGTGSDLYLLWPSGKILQLTNLDSHDLRFEDVSPNGRRFLFITPDGPAETNPTHNCQLYSVDDLGAHVRQITHFAETDRATSGCNFTLPRKGCGISTTFWDQVTNEIVTYSSCDPLGSNPTGGQLFAMRPDGSHLRQLTHARGLRIEEDGAVVTELPGPFRYSSPGF
jgi:hypothetical protein